ncbi:MAG TPA: MFS transporter [Actinomycetota bacterium]|jgi:MFS family permease|nr:MFS transporter [Actinomycetota bacterium]
MDTDDLTSNGRQADPVAPPPWRDVFRGRRGRLTAGLLVLEALVAVQSLVVATIMPDIREDLGMVQLYGLAFTSLSLATIASIPIVGRAIDRFGTRAVLVPVLAVFAGGLLVSATAPTMPVVLVGQFLQGAGGGGLYALSLGTVAKSYPDHLRPRVLALLATMWILPGLVGPPVGAAIASTIGWRWSFVAPIPVLVATWALIAPVLDLVPRPEATGPGVSLRWPLQLMVGAGFVFVALTAFEWWVPVAVAAGLAIGVPALRHIAPHGTFRASRGQGAVAAGAFLLSVSFLAMDAFLTLMLTRERGLSLAAAGLAITLATVTWALGAMWQSGRAAGRSLSWLVAVGTSFLLVGEAMVTSTLWPQVPLVLAYLGWGVVGAGMGIAFATIPLAAMRVSGAGEEGEELSSVLLMDMLGVATGAGLGGAAIALSDALEAPLSAGLAGAFGLALVAAAALLAITPRIPSGPLAEART